MGQIYLEIENLDGLMLLLSEAKKKGLMTTSRLVGIFKTGEARNEFMSLVK